MEDNSEHIKKIFEKCTTEVPGVQLFRAVNLKSFTVGANHLMELAYNQGKLDQIVEDQVLVKQIFNK